MLSGREEDFDTFKFLDSRGTERIMFTVPNVVVRFDVAQLRVTLWAYSDTDTTEIARFRRKLVAELQKEDNFRALCETGFPGHEAHEASYEIVSIIKNLIEPEDILKRVREVHTTICETPKDILAMYKVLDRIIDDANKA